MGVKFKKKKGKRFEDIIAKKIANALDLTRDDCHRASTSGTSSWDYGDIYVKDTALVVECKFHEDWDLRLFIPSFNRILKTWIEQLNDSTNKFLDRYHITPLSVLVISKAYYPTFYFINTKNNNEDVINELLLRIKNGTISKYIRIGSYIILLTDTDFLSFLSDVVNLLKI